MSVAILVQKLQKSRPSLLFCFSCTQKSETAIGGAYAVEHVLAYSSSHEMNIKPKFFLQVHTSYMHVLDTGAAVLPYFLKIPTRANVQEVLL